MSKLLPAVFIMAFFNILYVLAMSYPIMFLLNEFLLPLFDTENRLAFFQTFVLISIIRWLRSDGITAEFKG